MKYVLVLSYFDYSGVQRVFGPFDSEEEATDQVELLQSLLGLSGNWETYPLLSIVFKDWSSNG